MPRNRGGRIRWKLFRRASAFYFDRVAIDLSLQGRFGAGVILYFFLILDLVNLALGCDEHHSLASLHALLGASGVRRSGSLSGAGTLGIGEESGDLIGAHKGGGRQ